MSDPRRLWEKDGLGATEREALRVARQLDPPASLREDAWKALVAALPPPAIQGAAQKPPGSSGSGSSLAAQGARSGLPWLKVVVTAAAVCASAAGARWMASNHPPLQGARTHGSSEIAGLVPSGATFPPTSDDPKYAAGAIARPNGDVAPRSAEAEHRSPPTRGTTQPALARSATGPRPSQSAVHEVAGDPPAGSWSSGSSSSVPEEQGREPSPPDPGPGDAREESRMVARAREVLRAGNPAQAMALLDQVRTLYPSGVLVQERELLRIESLVRSGQRAPALERAKTFVRTWPESPYTPRVRELAAMP
jgi:hypothetical protein